MVRFFQKRTENALEGHVIHAAGLGREGGAEVFFLRGPLPPATPLTLTIGLAAGRGEGVGVFFPRGLLPPATSALLHNGSTILLSLDCLTDLMPNMPQ